MDHTRGDSRYNLNYAMSGIGLTLVDQADMYGNSASVTALGGRPPSDGILQGMSSVGGGTGGAILPRSAGNLLANLQCQPLVNNNNTTGHSNSQQRGLKRGGSDCYDDSHHHASAPSITSLQDIDNCGASSIAQHSSQQQQSQSSSISVQEIDDSYNNLQSKKSPPPNGKKTKGRVKIKMEYIDNKLRRYTTFSKRKTGIMKKAYELSTLTGTQVMLLVASETGHVYTFATRKLQPMITSEAGKQLIQTCLNSPDPPSVGGGDQRMSATGFEETELSYNIADEDSKEVHSSISSINDSHDSSDQNSSIKNASMENTNDIVENNCRNTIEKKDGDNLGLVLNSTFESRRNSKALIKEVSRNRINLSMSENRFYSPSDLSNMPQNVLLQLIEAGHLEVHTEEDGSGHQYVTIPLPRSTVGLESDSASANDTKEIQSTPHTHIILHQQIPTKLVIKEEH